MTRTPWLARLETLGNRLPHPTLLFVWLCLLLWPLTALLAALGIDARHGDEIHHVRTLLGSDGVRFMLTSLVGNFMHFAPLGVVLVAMLGIGLAERAGLLGAVLTALVRVMPNALLVPVVAFAGVMSSLAADAGYVVLIPLAAMLFRRAGRAPALGIAVAFAAVSGGYSANLLLGPVDALLAGLSTEAARLVHPDALVPASANYWFTIASTFLVVAVVSVVALLLPAARQRPAADDAAQDDAPRWRWGATVATLTVFLAALAWLTLPPAAPLRGTDGGLLVSPFMSGIVVVVALGFAVTGIAFGIANGVFRSGGDVIVALEDTMRDLAGYLVLMFFAAQFIAWFGWSNLGIVLAMNGAEWLAALDLPEAGTVVALVLFTALVNLLIGSASAKWAMLAPVFVPMMMLNGIDPATTQAAFRVGDSVTNIITPLMPYFALVLGFARRYQPDAGVGTLIALMLPFSVALLLAWTTLLGIWIVAGWPLGPGI